MVLERLAGELGFKANAIVGLSNVISNWSSQLRRPWRRCTPLSTLFELETLLSGIAAKAELWRSLELAIGAVTSCPLTEMVDRAISQGTRLESLHCEAARRAFEGAVVDAARRKR